MFLSYRRAFLKKKSYFDLAWKGLTHPPSWTGILAPVLTIAQHKWGVLNQLELTKGAQGAGQVAIGDRLASQFPIQLDQDGHPKAPDGPGQWPKPYPCGVNVPWETRHEGVSGESGCPH